MAAAAKGSSGTFGQVTASEVRFHPDEPVFILRAADPYAVQALIEYARRMEREGCQKARVDAAFDEAMRMAVWQRESPELVEEVWS